jgi:hypothetical protein
MIVKMIMKDDDDYMGVIIEGGVLLWECILGVEGVIEEYL